MESRPRRKRDLSHDRALEIASEFEPELIASDEIYADLAPEGAASAEPTPSWQKAEAPEAEEWEEEEEESEIGAATAELEPGFACNSSLEG